MFIIEAFLAMVLAFLLAIMTCIVIHKYEKQLEESDDENIE